MRAQRDPPRAHRRPARDRSIAEIRTADIEDFVADLKRPRIVNGIEGHTLTPASINRTLGLLRHYDNQKLEVLQAAVERLERGKTFEPQTAERPAKAGHYLETIYVDTTEGGGTPDKVSRIFQVVTVSPSATTPSAPQESPQPVERLLFGDLVAVRGFEPRSRG